MISVIHPSRGRPDLAKQTFESFTKNAVSEIEYILILDDDDYKSYDYLRFGNRVLIRKDEMMVAKVNAGAKVAKGNILFFVGDDLQCFPQWDQAILKEIGNRTDFVFGFDDGLRTDGLITHPIIDRIWYDRHGYFFNPAYKHNFCDNQITLDAEKEGKLIRSKLVFKHDRPLRKVDPTYERGISVFNEDRGAYNRLNK